MATATRRSLGTLVVLLVSFVLVAGTARTADAADGYKYWNYFHVTNGKYVFAKTGPADFTPKDGSVEAYRYGLSSTAAGIEPRTAATTYTVKDICAGTEAAAGQKLVGVLLDYGTAADADGGATPPGPKAACAKVPTDANGQQVLDAVADLRLDKSLTCGIDGYPVQGCSETVRNPPAAAPEQSIDFALPKTAADTGTASAASDEASSDSSGFPVTLVVVGLLVVALAAGGLVLSRRSKNA
jgi:hypothetical protein